MLLLTWGGRPRSSVVAALFNTAARWARGIHKADEGENRGADDQETRVGSSSCGRTWSVIEFIVDRAAVCHRGTVSRTRGREYMLFRAARWRCLECARGDSHPVFVGQVFERRLSISTWRASTRLPVRVRSPAHSSISTVRSKSMCDFARAARRVNTVPLGGHQLDQRLRDDTPRHGPPDGERRISALSLGEQVLLALWMPRPSAAAVSSAAPKERGRRPRSGAACPGRHGRWGPAGCAPEDPSNMSHPC